MKYKCIIKNCPTDGYLTSIDGDDVMSWPLCSKHIEEWRIYLAGAESEKVIVNHTPEWNLTVEKFIAFIAFTEKRPLDCSGCNLHSRNAAWCEYHGAKVCPRNL